MPNFNEKEFKEFSNEMNEIQEVLKNGTANKIVGILEKNYLSTIMNFEEKTTILDILIIRNDQDIINEVKYRMVTEEELKVFLEIKDKDMDPKSFRILHECLLYRSIKRENAAIFEVLCTPDVVNRKTLFMGPSVLETVVEHGRILFVKSVLTKLLKVNEFWNKSKNIAVEKGYNQIKSDILSREGLLNKNRNCSRLHIAVLDNDCKMLECILKNKYLDRAQGRKLYKKTFDDRSNTFHEMLDNNCELEAKDNDGQRAIHYAASKGYVDILNILLDYKCEVEARDNIGDRAIHKAVGGGGHVEILKILLENKCEIEAANNNGRRPIHLAMFYGHVEIFKILLENKCEIEATDKDGDRAIHKAVRGGHVEILKILLENKCEIEAANNCGGRPIHLAVLCGRVEILKILLENKCEIEATDIFEERPIHWAVICGQVEILKILLENKCEIEATNKDGDRAIHKAAGRGHVEILKTLLENKCEIKAANNLGKTAFQLASEEGQEGILDMFKKYNIE